MCLYGTLAGLMTAASVSRLLSYGVGVPSRSTPMERSYVSWSGSNRLPKKAPSGNVNTSPSAAGYVPGCTVTAEIDGLNISAYERSWGQEKWTVHWLTAVVISLE